MAKTIITIYYLPMRNWNNIFCLSALQNPKIYYLPMRNWNLAVIDRVSSNSNRIYYLPMRNWNHGCEWNFHDSNFIYYLPMRNWNHGCEWNFHDSNFIYYLPMRNWNTINPFNWVTKSKNLLLTYEELKLLKRVSFVSIAIFTTYLWGIETLKKILSKNFLNQIYYLPMRNWNIIFVTLEL